MKKLVSGIILSFVVLALFACTSSYGNTQVANSSTTPPAGQKSQSLAPKAWEVKWEKTLQDGRKEGKVVIYGQSFTKAIGMLAPEFKKKHGIELEIVITERGAEQVAKVLQERRAGLFLPDIYSGGTNTFCAN